MDRQAPEAGIALIVADAVERFDRMRESTSHVVQGLRARGVQAWLAEPAGIALMPGGVIARARRVVSLTSPPFVYALDDARRVPVTDFALVFIRHDPPVDDRFRAPLELLALVADRVRCINDPRTMLQWSEKTLPLRWPALTPATWIVSNAGEALDAIRACGTAIVKPLHRCGGSGVFLVRGDDSNAAPIVEECFRSEARLIVQQYLPGARYGDARILTLGDTVLGGFLRVPVAGSHRSNLHCQARLEPWRVTSAVARRLEPVLRTLAAEGVVFAGVDWIDGHLTEVNITSPMGLAELDATGFAGARGQNAADVLVQHCLGLAGIAAPQTSNPAHIT